MKRILLGIIVIIIVFYSSVNVKAQTVGTLTFSITPIAHSGNWGAKHVIAIWIENSSSSFVKTKIRYWGNGTNDHLPNWKVNSGQNVTDAITGATLSAYSTITITWDGKNVNGLNNGTLVADGDYKVVVEETWNHGTSGMVLTSYTFTKSSTALHLTPADDANFKNISLDWVLPVSVETIADDSDNIVFPNPTNGFLNVQFKKATGITIENAIGAVVYENMIQQIGSGSKEIDISNLTNGIYFVNIINNDKFVKYKIMLNK